MEFELKTGVQGHVYFPKRIRELFGYNLKAIPNTKALVIFGENTSPEDVIASLRVIISDLRLRVPQTQEHECRGCGHWQGRCMKGYVCRQNGNTIACREFIQRSGS